MVFGTLTVKEYPLEKRKRINAIIFFSLRQKIKLKSPGERRAYAHFSRSFVLALVSTTQRFLERRALRTSMWEASYIKCVVEKLLSTKMCKWTEISSSKTCTLQNKKA